MVRDLLSTREAQRVDAFICLSRIETGLREFLECQAPIEMGPKWRRSLPADVRERLGNQSLDVLYFADLRKILSSVWEKLADLKNVTSKSRALTYLEDLEGVRNDIAHSRYVQPGHHARLQATYLLFEPLIVEQLKTDETSEEVDLVETVLRAQSSIQNGRSLDEGTELVLSSDHRVDPEVVESVRAYDRVVRTPGQSSALLNRCQTEALNALREIGANNG